jgi:steroid delta-isomerase-like uncharacterized protein
MEGQHISDENKRLVRRIFDEVINQGDMAALDEIFGPDYVDHAAPPGLPPGRDGLKVNVGMFRTAFPDLHFTVEEMIAEGELVVTRRALTGTHRDELFGIPPTGKQVRISGIDISRVVDGRVVEHWGNEDDLGMLQQLGVIPPLGAERSP